MNELPGSPPLDSILFIDRFGSDSQQQVAKKKSIVMQGRHTISDVVDEPKTSQIVSKTLPKMVSQPEVVPEEPWEEVQEEQEEEQERELSYELFQPPPEDERNIGTIIKDTFGFYKKIDPSEQQLNTPQSCAENVVHRYTFCNPNGLSVQVISLGATITSIRMPDNKNVIGDVLLGFDTLEEYETRTSDKNALKFGSIFGRFSTLLPNAEIKIGRQEYTLSANVKGIHHDQGGFFGFDQVLWQSYVAQNKVIMTHVSPDGEEGYPGTVMVQLTFQLTKDNRFIVNTTATTSKPTILSLAHNLYFNMAGHESGPDGLSQHNLLVNADRIVKMDRYEKTPTGDLEEVGSTYFDLRVPRPIWKAIRKIPGGGYDHTFCLTKGYPTRSVTFACRFIHPNSGRYLEILTDMPGLYVNSGTKLPDPEALPPLEAQTGFNEDIYPQFCREEQKHKEYADEVQKLVATKQAWPRDAFPVADPEVVEALDDAVKPTEEMNEEEVKILEKEPSEVEDEHVGYRFLKDEAESEEEEDVVPSWSPPPPIKGKKGAEYRLNGAVCLIAQEYPDCMQNVNFPKPILKPGESFSRTTIYKFGVIPPRKEPELISYL